MTLYYTEYPTGTFVAGSDRAALKKSRARVVYRESDTRTAGRSLSYAIPIKKKKPR